MSDSAAAGMPRVVIVGGGFTGVSAAVQLVRASAVPLEVSVVEPAELGRGLAYATDDPDHRLNAPLFVHGLLPDDLWHFTRWFEAARALSDDPQALWPDGVVYARRSVFARYIAETFRAHERWAGSSLRWVRDRVVDLRDAPPPRALLPRPTSPTPPPSPTPETAETVANRAAPGTPAARAPRQLVYTAGGVARPADLVIVATGNARPRWPAALAPALAALPDDGTTAGRLIENPLARGALADVPRDARVLLLGSGLTALDVLATLLSQGHAGALTALSRHGLRPRPQAPLPEAQGALLRGAGSAAPGTERAGAALMLQRLAGAIPGFIDPAAGVAPSARGWLRALRREIDRAVREGLPWQQPFDALRDGLWRLWPQLAAIEQRRVLRQLRPWYDAHRFRSPPQTAAVVQRAEQRGQLRFRRGRVQQVRLVQDLQAVQQVPQGQPMICGRGDGAALRVSWIEAGQGHDEAFDVLVNCTGLDTAAGLAAHPLLQSLSAAGRLTPDACALGVAVDAHGRAIDHEGHADAALRVFGPPTLGSFGDPIGAFFIAAQIHRALPDMLAHLDAHLDAHRDARPDAPRRAPSC